MVKIESQSFPPTLEHPRSSLKCLVKIQSLPDSHEGGREEQIQCALLNSAQDKCGADSAQSYIDDLESSFKDYCNELVFNRFALKGTVVRYLGTTAGFAELINFQRQIGG
jgi:hypothetical protein